MIRFTCMCQHRIEVPEDMAGGLTQCVRCGRLNDVPTLSDLPHLADDGTYNVDVERPRDDPVRLAELSIIYAKGTTDSEGDEIDLRIAAGELTPGEQAAGDSPVDEDGLIPLKDEVRRRPRPAARPAPRYDPETGELIQALEVKADPNEPLDPAAIPVARAAISYASGVTAHRITPGRVMIELLMPVNVVVMGFIFISHVILQFTGTVTFSGLWFVGVIPLVLVGIIVSHYGNIVDEVGVQERDELPRPMRGCGLYEDLWMPFVHVFFALSLCFFPPFLVLMRTAELPLAVRLSLAALALAAGVVALPAVLLTSTTSGTMINLRPDRLVGVARVSGAGYGISVLLAGLATIFYGFGIVAADLAFIRVLTGGLSRMPLWVTILGYPMLAVGIYFAHLFCWHLGLLYREHHAQFPWAFQRYVRDPDADARRGTIGAAAATAGPTGAVPAMARPRKDTKAKLRELRELERKRRNEGRRAEAGELSR